MRHFVLAVLSVTGCAGTLEVSALQPHPLRLARAPETPVAGEELSIYTRESTLPRWVQLRHDASFVIVTRDRVRVHVAFCEPWEELADPREWTVELIGEDGRPLAAAVRDGARLDRVALEWEREPGWRPGSTGQKNRKLIPAIDVWRGRADWVFYGKDLLGLERRAVTVVARRPGRTLRFAWTFGDGWALDGTGRSPSDDALGIIAIPGPETRIASTRWLE